MDTKRDKIFTENSMEKFVFNDEVADVFDDMLNRSIPSYKEVVEQSAVIAGKFATEGSNIYDLGTSLGAVSFQIAYNLNCNATIISVDNSQAMLDRMKKKINRKNIATKIVPVLDDIENVPIENASVIVMNFTFQFIDPLQRDLVVKRIYDGMNDGALLILSEKVSFPDPDIHKFFEELYYEFKSSNGYTEMEISRKRKALEGVLNIETEESHIDRLKKQGFKIIEKWFMDLNFLSIMAIK